MALYADPLRKPGQPPSQKSAKTTASSPLRALLNGAARIAALTETERKLNFEPGGVAQRRSLPQKAAAPSASHAGLPEGLRQGAEALSGVALDDVRVHYNSLEPAKLGALAHAQGADIHLAPGQTHQLAHEAWHVVQQKQGRVRPTLRLRGLALNDDAGLEREADVMAVRALAASGGAGLAAPAVHDAGAPVVMRRIDPDFDTARGAAAGAVTKPQMQTFYDRFVQPEVARFSARTIDDDVKTAMQNADTVFSMFMLNSQTPAEIHAKLNALIVAVNAAADNWSTQLDARPTGGAELAHRLERERRQDSQTRAGVTQENTLRGVDSRAEAHHLLLTLHNSLNVALGAAFPLGQVGIRGSAVTGVRTRTQTPFEQGVAANHNVSDASDLDFFFTCPQLETSIRASERHLPANRRLNAGGTMNAQYLGRWLQLGQALNGYAQSGALLAALNAFTAAATARTGRKCDVTFIGGPTQAALAGDAGTLIY